MPIDFGDPFIEWGEENAAKEDYERESDMSNEFNLEGLKAQIVTELVTVHDLLMDDAATKVEEYYADNSDAFHENTVPSDLARFLASDDDDE